jgi:hypothetical protein
MKILDFPELRQMYNYDCGASSVQSILAFCGIDAREDHILNIANTTPKEGTLNDDVKRVLDYYEINYKEGTFTIEDLKKHIDANQPTIISLQAYADDENIDYKKSWDEGHNVVVIGYDTKNIYFEDPSSFKRTYLSFDELDDRWHDTDKDDKKVDHWGIVIKEKGKFKHNDTTKMESKSSRFGNYLNEAKDIENAYIEKYDTIGNIEIWKVDGSYIRTHIDDQFTNFGHHYQYKFIPENEFWLDKEAKEDDILFYIDHLIMEHRLMKDGMSYSKAIVIADRAERDSRRMSGDAKKLTDGGKRLPDGEQVHIRLWKKLEDGLSVWIVDGRLVRSVFDIDFTEGGHDYVYEFVPENEVWIDNDVVHKERGYVLLHELHERNIMSKGTPYSKAHMESSKIELQCRHNPDELHDALAEEGWT